MTWIKIKESSPTPNRNAVLEETADVGEGRAPGSPNTLTANEPSRTTEGAERPLHQPSRPRVAPSQPGPRERTCAEVPAASPPRSPGRVPREPEEGQVGLRALPCAVGGSAEVRHGRPAAGRSSPPLPASSGQRGRPAGPGRGAGPTGRLRKAARGGGAGARSREGQEGRAGEAGLGPRLHTAVCGREDLPPPPPLHLQPARDAAASFPQCTPALKGALSSLSPPPPSSPATFPAGRHAHPSAPGRVWREGGGTRRGCLCAQAYKLTPAS